MRKTKRPDRKRFVILLVLTGMLVSVFIGEYIVSHYMGNRDGYITGPLLSAGLRSIYIILIISVLVSLFFVFKDRIERLIKVRKRRKTNALQIIKKISFTCLTLLICFVILEILMIVLEPYVFKGFYQYDRDLGFKVRAYANGTNQFGFNDRDYSLDKPDSIFRILVLGDSFGWAGGMNGNYTALLEKKFEDYYGIHHVDVINASYPMTHTGEQLILLEKYGLQYKPDMVFLGFFAGNDFADANPYRKRIVVNDTYFDIDKREEKTLFGYPMIMKSRLWHFISQRLTLLFNIDNAGAQEENISYLVNPENNMCTFSEEAFLYIEMARLGFCHVKSYRQGLYNRNIGYIFQSLSRMQQLLYKWKIPLVMGIYPDEFQVEDTLLLQLFKYFDLEKSEFDVELMQKILKKHLDSCRIPYIDLLESFKVEAKSHPLYFCRNTHWNHPGNELAAAEIFRYLLPRIDVPVKKREQLSIDY